MSDEKVHILYQFIYTNVQRRQRPWREGWWRAWGLAVKKHEKSYCGDGNVLNLDYGDGCRSQ